MKSKLFSSLPKVFDKVKDFAIENASEIYAGAGIAGFIGTIVLVWHESRQAKEIVDKAEENLKEGEELSTWDKTKLTYKVYIPACVTATASTLCVLKSVSKGKKKAAIFATAYEITRDNYEAFKRNTIETIGEKKERQIEDKVAQEKASKPSNNTTIIYSDGDGKGWCLEQWSGITWRANYNDVKMAEFKINKKLANDNCISFNEYLNFLGVPSDKWPTYGSSLGFRINGDHPGDRDILEFNYDSVLDKDTMRQYLVVLVSSDPVPEYWREA